MAKLKMSFVSEFIVLDRKEKNDTLNGGTCKLIVLEVHLTDV
jgi:hypothetical protein